MIEEISFQFALKSLVIIKQLRAKHEYVFADQLLKSSTSIGANVCEAGAASSKRDFIAKIAIASREARETRYWLRLISRGAVLEICVDEYLEDVDQIIRILTKIVKTARIKMQ